MGNTIGKVILISAASSQIGREIARRLADAGHVVYAGYCRSKDNLPAGVQPVRLDVTDNRACRLAIKGLISAHGRLDAVINCVGVSLSGPAMASSPQDFQRLFDVNVVGPFRLVKYALPHLQKAQGTVVNITSLNSFLAYPNFGLYSATKHALDALGMALGYELGPRVRVINLAPGAVGIPDHSPRPNMPHRPLREKSFLFNLLMPLTSPERLSLVVERVIDRSRRFPSRIVVGNDATIVYFLKRLLPAAWMDKVIVRLWGGQK